MCNFLSVRCVCFVCVQPDDEESREEQEGEEGGVTFIAHVPVPSQKEVRHTHLSFYTCEDSH